MIHVSLMGISLFPFPWGVPPFLVFCVVVLDQAWVVFHASVQCITYLVMVLALAAGVYPLRFVLVADRKL